MDNKILKNVVVGFGGQFIVLLLGIIVPRLMLTGYGSDINGLISTIGQIFTYMALLEAGIGQAARNELYKPIQNKDKDGISFVVSVAQRYFRKITLFYGLGVVLISIALPFVIKTDIDYFSVFMVTFLQGISGVITFYYIQTPTVLLSVDGRNYINNSIYVVNQVIGYSVKIVMAAYGVNIILLQLAFFAITVCKVFMYRRYIKKHYEWIDYNRAPEKEKLKDRKGFIITEIAWTMFSSTDTIVLSVCVGTLMSSVYAIYNMVFSALNVILNSVFQSTSYILGQTYYKDFKRYEELHDTFMSVFFGIMTILMSIAYFMCIPFVQLYTQGVTDTEYIYPLLPLMFCLIQLISWSRYIQGNLTAVAGYVKQTSRISLIEAILNLALSIILVNKFGIVGVLFATVIALPMKVIYCTYLSDKVILKRSYKNTISILGVNYIFFTIVCVVRKNFMLTCTTWGKFFIATILCTIIISTLGILLNIMVNRNCLKMIKNYLLHIRYINKLH